MAVSLSVLTQFLPTRWQPYVPLGILLGWLATAGLAAAIRPPAPTSRWVGLYNLLNLLAFNFGKAVNALQPGRSAVMVPTHLRHIAREDVAERLALPVEETKP